MRGVLCVIVAAAAAAIGAAPVGAEATASTTVVTVPAAVQLSPGARALIEACVGEPLAIVGDGLLVVHRTTLPDGSRLMVIHRNPQGAFAVGTSSGATYRLGAADTLVRFTAPAGTFVSTFSADLHVIGPAGGAGFFGHILLHVTVTPDGNVTADIVVVDSHCA
jgi:hypothetical protein